MLSFQAKSDSVIREMVRVITQICMSREFQALKEELEQIYLETGQSDFDNAAFADALYAMLVQIEEPISQIEELL